MFHVIEPRKWRTVVNELTYRYWVATNDMIDFYEELHVDVAVHLLWKCYRDFAVLKSTKLSMLCRDGMGPMTVIDQDQNSVVNLWDQDSVVNLWDQDQESVVNLQDQDRHSVVNFWDQDRDSDHPDQYSESTVSVVRLLSWCDIRGASRDKLDKNI